MSGPIVRRLRSHKRLQKEKPASTCVQLADPTKEEAMKNQDDAGIDSDETDLDEKDFNRSKRRRRSVSQEMYLKACKKYKTPVIPSLLNQLEKKRVVSRHSSLGPLEVKSLCVALLSNITVTDVDLKGNCLDDIGAEFVVDMMTENGNITHLDLSENHLGAESAKIIGDMLKDNHTLRSLKLAGNNFKEGDAYHFARGLQANTMLKELDLGHNEFCEQGGILLGHLLAKNDSLEYLNLSWNHLRLKGAQGVAQGLQKNSSITHLDLSWNGFADDGAKAVAETLKVNSTLINLNLTCNRISHVGAKEIASALQANKSIETIQLSKNHITSNGAMELLSAVNKNKASKVVQLDLEAISVTYDMEAMIQEIAESRPGFKVTHGTLVLTDDIIGSSAAENTYHANPFRLLLAWAQSKGLRLWDLFSQFDKDGNRSISREEFREAMKLAQLPIDGNKLDQLIDYLDKDGDGSVDFGEMLQSQKEVRYKDRLKTAEKRRKSLSKSASDLLPQKENNVLKTTNFLEVPTPGNAPPKGNVLARRRLGQMLTTMMQFNPRNFEMSDETQSVSSQETEGVQGEEAHSSEKLDTMQDDQESSTSIVNNFANLSVGME